MPRFSVLINMAAGSVPDDADARLADALDGLDPTHIFKIPDLSFDEALNRMADSNAEIAIIWSGDGSLAAAFDHPGLRPGTYLPLPGGTMNMLHRQVHNHDPADPAPDWLDCLNRALANQQTIQVMGGRIAGKGCTGKGFYVAAGIGKLVNLVKPREAIRGGQISEAVNTLITSDALDMAHAFTYQIEPQIPSQEHHKGTATAIGVMPVEGQHGEFEFGIFDTGSALDLVDLGITSLVSDWRKAQGVTVIKGRSMTIRPHDATPLPFMCDGELGDPTTENLTVRAIDAPIRVLTARS